MPWTTADVDEHKKGLSAKQKETWVEVANKALAACEKEDKEGCEASAIKQANAVVGRLGESVSLADSIREALKKHDEQMDGHEEAAEPVAASFVEQAGQLIPWEGA